MDFPTVDVSLFNVPKIIFKATPMEFGVKMTITMHVLDINTRESKQIQFSEMVNVERCMSMDHNYKKQLIRRYLLEAITHEIDECLLIDGERCFDPHKPKIQNTPSLALSNLKFQIPDPFDGFKS